MALIITWRGGDDSTTIDSGTRVGFFGESFGESVPLGSYQTTTHVTDTSATTNYGALPNVKFVTNSTANWGSGELPLSTIPQSECTLHIRITNASPVRLQTVRLHAFSGSSHYYGPSNMILSGAELGDLAWTRVSGSASPLLLTPHIATASTIHDYYVALSAKPTAQGTNTSVTLAVYAEYY